MMLEARRTGNLHPKLRHLPLFQPPPATDSIVSPANLFRVHFLTLGDSAASRQWAEMIAVEADAAFRFQCDTLGFPKPAFTFADSLWHIYIVDLSDQIYGFTADVKDGELGQTPAGFTKLRSFIVLDNDYSSTPTKGLDAARITIQHEFFHVIQFGSYGVLEPISGGYTIKDINFIEMSSVWMEIRSTPWVPDFLLSLDTYLANIDKRFDNVPNFGYSQGIWPAFLQRRYGDAIMQETFGNYSAVTRNPLKAFDHGAGLHGSSFCQEYKEFGRELIETGRRYRGGNSLPNADRYSVDKLKVNRITSGTPVEFKGSTATQPASLNIVAAGFGEDTTFVTVARNTDFFESNATVTVTGKNAYTASYQFPEMFCDTLTEFDALKTEVFPVPFVIGDNETGSIFRLKATNTGAKPISPPKLTILTASMRLVSHSEEEVIPFGGSWYTSWDGTDDSGARVTSGVYVYLLEVDGKSFVGKFPVVVK